MFRSIFALFLILAGSLHAADLRGVSPEELLALQQKGALIVDIRTPEEWKATGVIEGSSRLTYFDKNGGYDKAVWLKELRSLVKSADQPVVLVCRSGNRSGMVGKELVRETGFGPVYHLEKGLRQWAAESGKLIAVQSSAGK